jgi:hypothetical protein
VHRGGQINNAESKSATTAAHRTGSHGAGTTTALPARIAGACPNKASQALAAKRQAIDLKPRRLRLRQGLDAKKR